MPNTDFFITFHERKMIKSITSDTMMNLKVMNQ